MQKISFDRIINRDWDCILKGKGLSKIKNIKRLNPLLENIPMSFQKVNEILKLNLDCLEYIAFWNDVEIYKVQ